MPTKTTDRSVRHQLQLILDNRGQVLPYQHQTDIDHPSVGWYVVPFVELPDCTCSFCASKRAGADQYIGYHLRDAIPVLDQWARAHRDAR